MSHQTMLRHIEAQNEETPQAGTLLGNPKIKGAAVSGPVRPFGTGATDGKLKDLIFR